MDTQEKSFAAASETSKLLITLCTGVLAFCVAVTNVKSADSTIFTPQSLCQKIGLAGSWLALLLSISVGAWAQLSIAHVLSISTGSHPESIWNLRIRVPFMLQIIFFLVGLLTLSIYATVRMFG